MIRPVGEVGFRGVWFLRFEVEAFAANYMLRSAITRAFRVPSSAARRMLSLNGLKPADPGVPSPRYRRGSEIERLAWQLGAYLESPLASTQSRAK